MTFFFVTLNYITKMFWYWISDLVAKVRSCTFILLNVFQWDRGINILTKSGKIWFHKSKIQHNGHYISTIITFLMFNLVDCFSTFLIANGYNIEGYLHKVSFRSWLTYAIGKLKNSTWLFLSQFKMCGNTCLCCSTQSV